MKKEDVFKYAEEKYQTKPDYPWPKFPGQAILRHKKTRKWYAAVLTVEKEKLGLPGEGQAEILNVKCEPELIGDLRSRPGFLPAYHMNKEHWLTIVLAARLSAGEIYSLLDLSYHLTKK